MKYYLLIICYALLAPTHSRPLFENQIATFIRDFILSGGSMDQDDEESPDFDELKSAEPESEEEPIEESSFSKDKEKKVLVFFKDPVMKRRGKREEKTVKVVHKKKLSRQDIQRIVGQLQKNLEGKPLGMRTIIDGLEEIPGGSELGELFSNSVLAAIREFFLQLVSNVM